MLTLELAKEALPAHLRSGVTQGLVDTVNSIAQDPEHAAAIRENFVTYSSVLREGKFKTEDYMHAVAYVSYKLMGYSNQESYSRTFPNRYQSMVSAGKSKKDISSYVAAFSKGKLVNLIYEQTLIPAWVIHQDTYNKAIETQAELMMTARSEKVRSDAANSILTHLKKPETKKVELDLGIKDNSGMAELKTLLTDLAQQQRSLIAGGMKTQEIAHQKIIEAEAIDVTPEKGDEEH